MPALLASLGRGLLDLLLPRHCPVTGTPLRPEEPGPVSAQALRSVTAAGADYCRRCGAIQGPGVGVVRRCGRCNEARSFAAREMVVIGDYEGVLREMCLALKFGSAPEIARPLAVWLAELVSDRGLAARVDAVCAVPLHAWREWRRGYNQSEELARALARLLGKPCLSRALVRLRRTQPQTSLSAAERRSNVKGAFSVRRRKLPAVTGKNLLLVDDILTTGATFAEAARTLRKAGAGRIFGAVAARSTVGADS